MSKLHKIIEEKFSLKTKKEQWRSTKKAVIYTRVSTKEQADGNTSLETQLKECERFAERKDYNVVQYFGGTYESAKTDERKELQRMLVYVKKHADIEAILVYSYDRFSRSDSNQGILLQLKKSGVKVLAVTQEVDPTSANGEFQMKILLLFANLDNETRRNKTMQGMIENLRNGYWVGACPFGYSNRNRKDKAKNHDYFINDDGAKLKLAFAWKAEGKLNNKEIVERLNKIGCNVQQKHISRIFSNPFYCGYVRHSLIEKPVKGRHPALVSEQIFLKANKVLEANPLNGRCKQFRIEELPLKGFAFDEISNSPLTGYKRREIFYYKSRDIGSCVNVRASHLNDLFVDQLRALEVSEANMEKLKVAIKDSLISKLSDQLQEMELTRAKLSKVEKNLDKIQERFALDEIDRETYVKLKGKYEDEIRTLKGEVEKSSVSSSNIEKLAEKGIAISGNLSQLWLSSDYVDKQKLQRLVFPEGIGYNKENDVVRTFRVNTIFGLIAAGARVSENKNDCNFVGNSSHSHLVAPPRIERGS